jgi:hypothetical protein
MFHILIRDLSMKVDFRNDARQSLARAIIKKKGVKKKGERGQVSYSGKGSEREKKGVKYHRKGVKYHIGKYGKGSKGVKYHIDAFTFKATLSSFHVHFE